jgi:hypothetical protein
LARSPARRLRGLRDDASIVVTFIADETSAWQRPLASSATSTGGPVDPAPAASDPSQALETAGKTVYRELRHRGLSDRDARAAAAHAHCWWYASGFLSNAAFPNSYFDQLGVPRLAA